MQFINHGNKQLWQVLQYTVPKSEYECKKAVHEFEEFGCEWIAVAPTQRSDEFDYQKIKWLINRLAKNAAPDA